MKNTDLLAAIKANLFVGLEGYHADLYHHLRDLEREIAGPIGHEVMVWHSRKGFRSLEITETGTKLKPTDYKVNGDVVLSALEYIENDPKVRLYIMVDLHLHITSPIQMGALKELVFYLQSAQKRVLLVGEDLKVLAPLRGLMHFTGFQSLTGAALESHILSYMGRFKRKVEQSKRRFPSSLVIDLTDTVKAQLVAAASGLPLTEVEDLIRLSIQARNELGPATVTLLQAAKSERLKQLGLVPIQPLETPLVGLEHLQKFLRLCAVAMRPEAQALGLPKPKGVLLVGPPGTGKSQAAKYLAQMWNVSGFRLPIASLFSSLLGETEQRLRQVIAMLEASAPCVVHIDELDKAFKSASSASTDSGTSERIFGEFLTWLADNASGVFVIATANDVRFLPSELLRKGRFDEIFFVDVPNTIERQALFELYAQKYDPQANLRDLMCSELAFNTQGFSAAEIKAVCERAAWNGYERSLEGLPYRVTYADLNLQKSNIKPLVVTEAAKFRELYEWSRTVPSASATIDVTSQQALA